MSSILITYDNYQGVQRSEYDTTYMLLKILQNLCHGLVALISITTGGDTV